MILHKFFIDACCGWRHARMEPCSSHFTALGLSCSICRMRRGRPAISRNVLKWEKDHADPSRKRMIRMWDAPSSWDHVIPLWKYSKVPGLQTWFPLCVFPLDSPKHKEVPVRLSFLPNFQKKNYASVTNVCPSKADNISRGLRPQPRDAVFILIL